MPDFEVLTESTGDAFDELLAAAREQLESMTGT
jgi:hypothetical protein